MKTIEKVHEMKHVAWIAVAALLLVALLGLAACSSSDEGTDESSDTDATNSDTANVEASDFEDLDEVNIILADCASPDSSGNLWSLEFADQISDITGGKMTVEYHGNSELGGDTDLATQEQSNDIQMVATQPAPLVSFIPALAAFDLPMAFATYDADQIETVLNGDNEFTEALQEAYNDAGFYNLGFLQSATFRETTSNKDLSTLDDFNGFMIRTMENANHMAFWKALGAEPTPMAFSEVYFALQNGTVDGQENPTDTAVGNSLQEVQKYLCMTNHILSSYNMSINKEFWDSLDPAYQEAIEQAVSASTENIASQLSDLDEECTQIMLDAGMELIEYDDDFVDQVLAIDGVQDLYEDISDQTDGISDMLINELEKTNN